MNKNSSQKALLAHAIDYAGLFPPAALDLPGTLANYRSYQRSPDAWALGRFVIAAERLEALSQLDEADGSAASQGAGQGLPLSVVVGPNDFVRERAPRTIGRVAAVELKAATAGAARTALEVAPEVRARYLEVPVGPAGAPALEVIRDAGVFAKLRTGGVTADAFPSADDLLWSVLWLARNKIPWKATAGLHHPLRGAYPLGYEAAARTATMFGFLNLFLAALLCWAEESPGLAREALLEESRDAIRFEPDALVWRGRPFGTTILGELRESFLHGFGSCSFREPLDELAAGSWGERGG